MRSTRLTPVPTEQTFINDLPVSTRARRWLLAGGVHTVGHLLSRTEQDLLTLDNFSHTSLANVKRFLAKHNLQLQPPRSHDCTGSMIRQALADRSFRSLSPRERKVLKLRHGVPDNQPRTLAEVGRRLKLTRERVRQIQKLAEEKVIAHHVHVLSGDATKPSDEA